MLALPQRLVRMGKPGSARTMMSHCGTHMGMLLTPAPLHDWLPPHWAAAFHGSTSGAPALLFKYKRQWSVCLPQSSKCSGMDFKKVGVKASLDDGLIDSPNWDHMSPIPLAHCKKTSILRLRSLNLILGCTKRLFSFFCKIKDSFFIFTNSFIELDILNMPATSHMAERWLFSMSLSIWSLSTSAGLSDCGASSRDKCPANCFWHVQSVTAPSLYTAQFLCVFQLCFYLSWKGKT